MSTENRFVLSYLAGPGTITASQERFLIHQSVLTLAKHRRALGIFSPIPKLTTQQAWKLINRISQDPEAR